VAPAGPEALVRNRKGIPKHDGKKNGSRVWAQAWILRRRRRRRPRCVVVDGKGGGLVPLRDGPGQTGGTLVDNRVYQVIAYAEEHIS